MKALLVIDMLEDFFEDGPLCEAREELTSSINRLLLAARTAKLPIIWVRQEFRDDLEDAFLVMRKRDIRIAIAGTPGSRILEELKKEPADYEVIKKRYSAFYNTDLDTLLLKLDVSEVLLAGVNTHACIRTAAIDAYQRDLEVTIPEECVLSNDQQHHDVTLEYLGKEIATVAPLDQILVTLVK